MSDCSNKEQPLASLEHKEKGAWQRWLDKKFPENGEWIARVVWQKSRESRKYPFWDTPDPKDEFWEHPFKQQMGEENAQWPWCSTRDKFVITPEDLTWKWSAKEVDETGQSLGSWRYNTNLWSDGKWERVEHGSGGGHRDRSWFSPLVPEKLDVESLCRLIQVGHKLARAKYETILVASDGDCKARVDAKFYPLPPEQPIQSLRELVVKEPFVKDLYWRRWFLFVYRHLHEGIYLWGSDDESESEEEEEEEMSWQGHLLGLQSFPDLWNLAESFKAECRCLVQVGSCFLVLLIEKNQLYSLEPKRGALTRDPQPWTKAQCREKLECILKEFTLLDIQVMHFPSTFNSAVNSGCFRDQPVCTLSHPTKPDHLVAFSLSFPEVEEEDADEESSPDGRHLEVSSLQLTPVDAPKMTVDLLDVCTAPRKTHIERELTTDTFRPCYQGDHVLCFHQPDLVCAQIVESLLKLCGN